MRKNIIKIWTMFIFAMVTQPMWSQNLSLFEYWFDGQYDAKKTKTLSGKEADVTLDIATDGLTTGIHRVHYRTKNADGTYSGISSSYFFKTSPAVGNKLEYWFDDDFDNRGSVGISATGLESSISSLLKLGGASAFPEGFHRLNFRVVAANGNYSSVQTACVLNLGAFQSSSKLEYWFDHDFENRASRDISGASEVIDVDALLDLSNLEQFPLGMHRLHYRVATPTFGITPIHTAFIMNKGNGGEPCQLEYWLDDDKEHSKLLKGNATGNGTYSIIGNLNLGNLAKGFHRLNYRATTTRGNNSAVQTNLVYNAGTGSAPSKLEYWIDEDVAHSKSIEGTQMKDGSYTITGEIDLSDVEVGVHNLHYRITSQNAQNFSSVGVKHIYVSGGEIPAIEYWFDDDMANTNSMNTKQYGNVFMVDESVDVSSLSVGMHMLNYRISSPNRRYDSGINTTAIMVMPKADFFNRQNETTIVSGIYWVDDMKAKQFENFQEGVVVDLEELINLADLEDGQHVFSMRFVDSNGKWTDVDKTVFTKMQLNGTQTIAGIIYKYVESADAPYVAAIGYDENMQKADILSTVSFGGKDVEVQAIDASAFYGADDIAEIAHIPSTVKTIGDKAFAGASVNEVNLNAKAAPKIGTNAFPSGTNLRVPIGATGYESMKQKFAGENVLLTYDLGCIYDSQWETLKRIDAMVRAQGGNTGWDFTDRTSTPAGVSRFGTDHVYEINLSNHGLSGSYESVKWSEGLPKVSSINLSANSIVDMTNSEGYGVLRLDSQQYDYVLDVHIDRPDVDQLLSPEIPLIFRDANRGTLGSPYNQTLTYRLGTKTPDESYLGEWQEEYSMLLTVAPNGTIKMAQNSGNKTNVYREKSGQELCVTSSGIQTLTPGSYFKVRFYFGDGDVNLDGFADVTDLQKVINYIFEYGSTAHIFAWHAANLADDDDIINVQDVVGVVDVLLKQTPEDMSAARETLSNRRKMMAMLENEYVEDEEETSAFIFVSDEGLSISCEREVAALDLVVSQDIDFTELKRLGFVVSRAQMANGKEHVVAYSLGGAVIPAGEHIIGTDTAGKTIIAATLADIESERINTVINNGATGIEIADGDSDDGGIRYDLSGRIVNNAQRGFTIQKGQVRYSDKSK